MRDIPNYALCHWGQTLKAGVLIALDLIRNSNRFQVLLREAAEIAHAILMQKKSRSNLISQSKNEPRPKSAFGKTTRYTVVSKREANPRLPGNIFQQA